ncbi:MAG TPA: tRNA lysidine(34) synthetase TilS [Sphingomonadaceae bacterium]|nr:tRNA lysidine(34) synthetase TilS [Sphingomonadaceae bacterium]
MAHDAPAPLREGDRRLTRFRADFGALIGAPARFGVAVSGGADSLALLLLADAAFAGAVRAATVDHRLRPEAAAEAAMVAAVCAARGIPHRILVRPENRPVAGQGGARELRYALLGAWAEEEGLADVATAHHRDDVAESFLLRAARGAGVSGLAAMRAVAPWPTGAPHRARVVRPLLGWTRAELAAIVADSGLTPAEDPSNADPHYDRTHARALLRREPWLRPERLARTAANLADADSALQWLADEAWRSRAVSATAGQVTIDVAGLPRETRRRLAARAIGCLNPGAGGEGIDRLVDRLDAGAAASLAGVRAGPGACWRFTLAPPRRNAQKGR